MAMWTSNQTFLPPLTINLVESWVDKDSEILRSILLRDTAIGLIFTMLKVKSTFFGFLVRLA